MTSRSFSLSRTFYALPLSGAFLSCSFSCAQADQPPVAASQTAAEVLIPLKNADFEAGLDSWVVREKTPMTQVVPEAAHSGKMGLRVLDEDGTAGSNALSTPVTITAGQTYRLCFWAKTTSGNAAVVQLRYYDSSRKTIESPAGKLPIVSTGGQWKELSLTDTAPATAVTAAIWVHSYSGAKATLDFDDFLFYQTNAAQVTNVAPLPPAPEIKAETPAPAAAATSKRLSPPYIIIKADDLRNVNGRVHARWRKFADFIKDRKVKASIGLITNSLEGDHPQYINWIKEQQATGLFEFWNHGYVHEPTKVNEQTLQEFKGTTYEQQKEAFTRAQQLGREKLGAPFTTFGAPSNASDENTIKVLSEDPDTKIWLYGNEKNDAGKMVLTRIYPVNIENPLFLPSLDKFIEGYNRYPQREYFVIQGHAAKWDDERFDQFSKIVDFLIAEKAVFVTPSEYAQIKAAKTNTAP